MVNVSKIDKAGLGKVVLELSLKHSTIEIVDQLKKDHGLKVSVRTVDRFIDGVRSERAAQTQAVINEHIKESIPGDLSLLDTMTSDLKDLIGDACGVRDKVLVYRELRGVIETKLKYSGAGVHGQAQGSGVVVYLPGNGRDTR